MIVGAVTGVALSQNLNIPLTTAVGFATLGSIIVDIDEEHSLINKTITLGITRYRNIVKGIIGTAMLAYPMTLLRYIGALLLLSIISNKYELRFSIWSGPEIRQYHRTIFHDPIIGIALFIIPILILRLPKTFILPYMIGVILHYIFDSFTAYGLPLILFKGKTIRMPIYYHSKNYIIEAVILCCYIGLLYWTKLVIIG